MTSIVTRNGVYPGCKRRSVGFVARLLTEGNLTPSRPQDSLRSHRVIGPRADDIVDYQIEGVRLNAAGGERASARISI